MKISSIYVSKIGKEENIPDKPSDGCPAGSTATGENDKHCCCDFDNKCCWHKCPIDGTAENLEKLSKCGMEKQKWAYAKLPANGNARTFVAQAGNKSKY